MCFILGEKGQIPWEGWEREREKDRRERGSFSIVNAPGGREGEGKGKRNLLVYEKGGGGEGGQKKLSREIGTFSSNREVTDVNNTKYLPKLNKFSHSSLTGFISTFPSGGGGGERESGSGNRWIFVVASGGKLLPVGASDD